MAPIARRSFIGGLIALCAAPAIIRPGLLMPIKPSLVPPYRLVQAGFDCAFTSHEAEMPIGEFAESVLGPAMRALARHVEGLVEHNDRPPLEGFIDARYVGNLRRVEYYERDNDRRAVRYDGFWRDYRAEA